MNRSQIIPIFSFKAVCATILLLACSFAVLPSASAFLITGQGDPLDVIPGGTVVDMESFAIGDYTDLSQSGLTIAGSSDNGGTGGPLRIADHLAGQLNSRDTRYLDNGAGVGYQTILLTFAQPVTEFAFLWGASDVDWTLTAFDAANVPLEVFVIGPTDESNAGDYFGVSNGTGIVSATITSTDIGFEDWVFVDNITFSVAAVAVPEASSLALVLPALAMAGAVIVRRRK